MSTRCVINFCHERTVFAKVYRHSDGYPDSENGVIAAMQQFFNQVENDCGADTRFGDPSYLAAKFVVWQANLHELTNRGGRLSFLGVGVMMKDPADVEYLYNVECTDNRQRPVVTCKEVKEKEA